MKKIRALLFLFIIILQMQSASGQARTPAEFRSYSGQYTYDKETDGSIGRYYKNYHERNLHKALKGYGEWVQRSAFECHLTLRQYEKMIADIFPYFDFTTDLLRIYRLTGQTEVKVYGRIKETEDEDLIII